MATTSTRPISIYRPTHRATWQTLPPLPVTCVMPMCSIIRLKDGSYLGKYNDRKHSVVGVFIKTEDLAN